MNLESLMQYMNVGGMFVIWALVGCSVIVVAVCLERIFALLQYSVNSEWLLKQMAIFVSHNRLADAIEFCNNRKWLLAKVFKTGLYRAHCDREDILDGMGSTISSASLALESNLSILGTIAVIAPFVGLFGTVLGIIQAFNDIAKHGKTGIETVGAGVAEALITTAGGLLVAILAVVAFNFFKSKIKRMITDISDQAERLGELLHFQQTGIAPPADLAYEAPSEPSK